MRNYVKWYKKPKVDGMPLYAEIPSFIKYWNKCHARTDWRKAHKKGYTFHKVGIVPHKAIIDIWKSRGKEFQKKGYFWYTGTDRKSYPFKEEWPVDNYCHVKEKMFLLKPPHAYAEVVVYRNEMFVHSTLGHKDHLKDGVMKFLFVELAKWASHNKIKRIYYGFSKFLKDKRQSFVKDLLYVNQVRNK